ncbi:MAG: hypothetical protein RQ723_12025 [Desulfuromonadales bacterium]|nr:hypothetical protein [Desulfuromonadales bacterium]
MELELVKVKILPLRILVAMPLHAARQQVAAGKAEWVHVPPAKPADTYDEDDEETGA